MVFSSLLGLRLGARLAFGFLGFLIFLFAFFSPLRRDQFLRALL